MGRKAVWPWQPGSLTVLPVPARVRVVAAVHYNTRVAVQVAVTHCALCSSRQVVRQGVGLVDGLGKQDVLFLSREASNPLNKRLFPPAYHNLARWESRGKSMGVSEKEHTSGTRTQTVRFIRRGDGGAREGK